MATAQTVIEYVQGLTGHPINADEGVHYGKAEREVHRVTVCWMATGDALESAGSAGADLVIAHESLFYPYGKLLESGKTQDWESWPTNRRRVEVLDRYGMTLLRLHGSLDEVCIFDDFAALLGLGKPVEAEGLTKVYEIPPCTVDDLVARVKAATKMSYVRVSAPRGLHQQVRRIGLPWGGVGLFVNVGYQQGLIARKCDAFIAGESDDYGFRFAAELGIPMIETGHAESENPGLRRFTQMLTEHFPDVVVSFYECRPAWKTM